MRRAARVIALIVAGLCLLVSGVSADTLQEKTFAYTGARWPSPNTNVATFWEAPTLAAGESRTGGVLTLENATEQSATITLTEFSLPYDNEQQMAYLNQLHLQIAESLAYRSTRRSSFKAPCSLRDVFADAARTSALCLLGRFVFSLTGSTGFLTLFISLRGLHV